MKVPDDIDWKQLDAALRKRGVVVGGSFGPYAGAPAPENGLFIRSLLCCLLSVCLSVWLYLFVLFAFVRLPY